MIRLSLSWLTVALVSSCNSDMIPDPVPDYREAFEGQYVGTSTNSSWVMNGPTTSSEIADTVEVVSIGDSSLLVNGVEIQISKSGEFYEQGNGASSFFSGQFSLGNRLRTDLNGGGLGGGYHSTFIGYRH